MTYEEAFEAAVLGERVCHTRLGEGTFIDYNFSGLRINHPAGAQSGYRATPEDQAVEWSIFVETIDFPNVISREQAERLAKHDRDSGWGKAMAGLEQSPSGTWVDRAGMARARDQASSRPAPVLRGRSRLQSMPIEDVDYGEPSKPLPVWPKSEPKKELPKWT